MPPKQKSTIGAFSPSTNSDAEVVASINFKPLMNRLNEEYDAAKHSKDF